MTVHFVMQSFQLCTNGIEFDLKFLFLKMHAYLELHVSEIENKGKNPTHAIHSHTILLVYVSSNE